MKLYLNLEWIFERLAHEKSFKVFKGDTHIVRNLSTDFIFKHLTLSQTLLDLGCNTGELTFRLSSRVKKVVGIDNNSSFIELAKKNYPDPKITFICDDALAYLKQNTQSFDVLVLSHILEHLDDPESLLLSFKNFFKYIFIEVPDFERTPLNVYRHQLKQSLIYSDADHIWEFDRTSMQELIKKTGLTILDSEYKLGVQKYWCKVTP